MRHFAVSVDVPFKFSIASFSVNIIPLQVLRHPVNISPRIARPDRSGIFKIPVQVVRHPVNISPRITRPVRKLSAIVWNTLFGRYFVHPHKKKRWSLRVGPLRFLHPPYALPDRPWGA